MRLLNVDGTDTQFTGQYYDWVASTKGGQLEAMVMKDRQHVLLASSDKASGARNQQAMTLAGRAGEGVTLYGPALLASMGEWDVLVLTGGERY